MLNTFTLDRQSPLPLYYQIQQMLLGNIRSGVLKAGDSLPSEQEIAAKFRISRMTARQALKSLSELGAAYSQRGKGTFVSPFKMEKPFRQVLSFTEEMRASGSRPSSRVLSFETFVPSGEIAHGQGRADCLRWVNRVALGGSVARGPTRVPSCNRPCVS